MTESTLDLNTKIKNGSKKKRLLNYAVRILESLFHNVFNLFKFKISIYNESI